MNATTITPGQCRGCGRTFEHTDTPPTTTTPRTAIAARLRPSTLWTTSASASLSRLCIMLFFGAFTFVALNLLGAGALLLSQRIADRLSGSVSRPAERLAMGLPFFQVNPIAPAPTLTFNPRCLTIYAPLLLTLFLWPIATVVFSPRNAVAVGARRWFHAVSVSFLPLLCIPAVICLFIFLSYTELPLLCIDRRSFLFHYDPSTTWNPNDLRAHISTSLPTHTQFLFQDAFDFFLQVLRRLPLIGALWVSAWWHFTLTRGWNFPAARTTFNFALLVIMCCWIGYLLFAPVLT